MNNASGIINLNIAYTGQVPLYPISVLPTYSQRIILEIGPGHGEFLLHLAEKNPDAIVHAIEIRQKRVLKISEKIKKRGLTNAKVIWGNAHYVLPAFYFRRCVNEIHVNFPDPWPKQRHAQNRLLQEAFFDKIASHLTIGGSLNIVTDDPNYAVQIRKESAQIKKLRPDSAEEIFPSVYYQKWRFRGRQFFPMKWRRIEN